ncbi:hypothetical protein PR048_015674 [Dryococelus australis]|uniref:Uncharacterized protein n=1 Tax=Dryococelus australis TaxID=614101 RepID=A0ABQ9HHN7_9NEOP|nr:hypothetical protein PR048_015674 [Dryococelus australis]
MLIVRNEALGFKANFTSGFMRGSAFNAIGAGIKGRGVMGDPREDPPTKGSSGTIPTCESPVTRPGIELGSLWWEASVLIAQPPFRKDEVKVEFWIAALRWETWQLTVHSEAFPDPFREKIVTELLQDVSQTLLKERIYGTAAMFGAQFISPHQRLSDTCENTLIIPNDLDCCKDAGDAAQREYVPLAVRLTLWLQQDGCPAHFLCRAQLVADMLFPRRIKEIVYCVCPTTREDMKDTIREACGSLSCAEVRRSTANWFGIEFGFNRYIPGAQKPAVGVSIDAAIVQAFSISSIARSRLRVTSFVVHYLTKSNWAPAHNVCSVIVTPLESRRATTCGYNSSRPVWHALYECLQDIHGDSSPFLLQPFHELSNGFWPRLTIPHPAIQFVPNMCYRVKVGALGGPVQSANIVVGVPLHRRENPEKSGATVVEWLERWPPTKAILVRFLARSVHGFSHVGIVPGRCCMSASLLWYLPLPPPSIPGSAPYPHHSPLICSQDHREPPKLLNSTLEKSPNNGIVQYSLDRPCLQYAKLAEIKRSHARGTWTEDNVKEAIARLQAGEIGVNEAASCIPSRTL